MALTESDIKIIIAAELKKAGFDKAKKATSDLEKGFKRLGQQATKTFVAIAGFQAIKRSVTAFVEEDRAVQKLTQSLNNLGLGYNVGAIERFISATQAATGVNDAQLRPAMVQLTTTTLDAQKAMQLLTVAMDISAATGASLDSTTTALSRAYKGNYGTLGKLQTAYSTSELKAMGFEASVAALTEAFGGSAAANADSYGGKVDKLKIAFDEASESIGKGFIDALTLIGEGNFDKVLMSIANGANTIGTAFVKVTAGIELFKELLKSSLNARISPEEQARMDALKMITISGVQRKPGENTAAANRQFLSDYKKQVALQKKVEADRKKAAALAAKADAERLKREKDAQLLKRAGTIFDMENIQIVAALQGRINEEQRLRLVALLAINNDIADAADKTTSAILALQAPMLNTLGIQIKASDNASTVVNKIVDAQTKLFLVNAGISNIPKAKNPFEDWDEVMKNIIKNLDAIAEKITKMPSATTAATTSTTTSITTPTGNTTTTTTAIVPSAAAAVAANIPSNVATTSLTNEANVLATARLTAQLETIMEQFQATNDIRTLQYEAMQRLYPGRQVLDTMTPDYQSYRAGERGAPTVIVNVAGSVTAEADLAETIREYLFDYQKTGGDIRTTAIAI